MVGTASMIRPVRTTTLALMHANVAVMLAVT